MKKISTLFKKDPNDLGRVIDELNPENKWVLTNSIATRKFDGTACAIIDGELYKRYDAKHGKKVPIGAIPCQEPDEITGHHPHWVECQRGDNSSKYHFEAFDRLSYKENGTYELCGEKIQGNPEKLTGHSLIKHGAFKLGLPGYSFEELKNFLKTHDLEGIVFYHLTDGRMCKLRKTDFGYKR